MGNLSLEEIKTAVEDATKKAIEEKLGDLYIDRKQHFQDHEWLKSLREWSDNIKSTALKTIVRCIVTALIGLFVLGFVYWGQHNNFR